MHDTLSQQQHTETCNFLTLLARLLSNTLTSNEYAYSDFVLDIADFTLGIYMYVRASRFE